MCIACNFMVDCLCGERTDLLEVYSQETVEEMLYLKTQFYRSVFGGIGGGIIGETTLGGSAAAVGGGCAVGFVSVPVGLCLLGKCWDEMKDCCEKKNTNTQVFGRDVEIKQDNQGSKWSWLCCGTKQNNVDQRPSRTQSLLNNSVMK